MAAAPSAPFKDNYPFPGAWNSDPGPFPPGVIFRNGVKRTDKQLGLFGEATFDVVPDKLSLTAGARYYDVKVDFAGSANGSFCNSFSATDQNAFGTNISDLYDGDGQYTFVGSCDPCTAPDLPCPGDSVADIMAAGLS